MSQAKFLIPARSPGEPSSGSGDIPTECGGGILSPRCSVAEASGGEKLRWSSPSGASPWSFST